MIPACVDCHEPHKIRKVFYTAGMSDGDCMTCHGNPGAEATTPGRTGSLYVSADELAESRHSRLACVQCHTGGTPSDAGLAPPSRTRWIATSATNTNRRHPVQPRASTAQLAAQGSPDAPALPGLPRHARHSGQERSRFAHLFAQCAHAVRQMPPHGHKAAVRYNGTQDQYGGPLRESIHGKGLLQAGLTVTANCADCHTPHHELPANDPRSSVNRDNVAETCAKCHRGIYELFTASVHSPNVTHTNKPLPVCSRLPLRPQHRTHRSCRLPAGHHGPVRPLSSADHRCVFRDLPWQGLQAGRPENRQVLRLPRRA